MNDPLDGWQRSADGAFALGEGFAEDHDTRSAVPEDVGQFLVLQSPVGDDRGGAERSRGKDHVEHGDVIAIDHCHAVAPANARCCEGTREPSDALLPLSPGEAPVAEDDGVVVGAFPCRPSEGVAQHHLVSSGVPSGGSTSCWA